MRLTREGKQIVKQQQASFFIILPSHLLFCSKRKKERKKKAQQTSLPKIDDKFFFPFGHNLEITVKVKPRVWIPDSIQRLRSTERYVTASILPRATRGAGVASGCLHVTAGPPKRQTRICPHTCKQFRAPSLPTCTSLDYGRKLEAQQGTQTDTQHWKDKHTLTDSTGEVQWTHNLVAARPQAVLTSVPLKMTVFSTNRLKTLHHSQDFQNKITVLSLHVIVIATTQNITDGIMNTVDTAGFHLGLQLDKHRTTEQMWSIPAPIASRPVQCRMQCTYMTHSSVRWLHVISPPRTHSLTNTSKLSLSSTHILYS